MEHRKVTSRDAMAKTLRGRWEWALSEADTQGHDTQTQERRLHAARMEYIRQIATNDGSEQLGMDRAWNKLPWPRWACAACTINKHGNGRIGRWLGYAHGR